ncbi:uncharacterized protein A4U43_UnF4810 [Asparagus officinalis]|uniref:Uncharacterized protein n=1 Tax=Asparagus officinalis TaxID=4686 RepID=A0A1R3L6T3_ASPOF|nr:uncharacterized protein A4U43_UnF4810 [Asparagus officinalis]
MMASASSQQQQQNLQSLNLNRDGSEEDKGEKIVADRYLKRELLSEGTYGVIFKALDTKKRDDMGFS